MEHDGPHLGASKARLGTRNVGKPVLELLEPASETKGKSSVSIRFFWTAPRCAYMLSNQACSGIPCKSCLSPGETRCSLLWMSDWICRMTITCLCCERVGRINSLARPTDRRRRNSPRHHLSCKGLSRTERGLGDKRVVEEGRVGCVDELVADHGRSAEVEAELSVELEYEQVDQGSDVPSGD